MKQLSHNIHKEDGKLYIIYPLNYSEYQIQKLIEDLEKTLVNNEKEFNLDSLEQIILDTEDIAISLLFFFQKLLKSKTFQNSNTKIYFHPKVYESIKNNFHDEPLFQSEKIKKVEHV
jgi:hypothetical protein